MDRYGRTQEGSQSDPWPETGLEEGVWRLGLGEEESGYPERPNEADCIYYLRTGFCGYGSRCRFNHPPDRGAVLSATRTGAVEFPERVGQPVCQYYMRTGTCKFGASCKYHHPKQGGGSVSPVPLNYHGYPLRPGEKECTYYLKTGQCKFGATCKFHHPQPVNLQIPAQSMAPQVAPLPAPPVPAPAPAPGLYPAIQSPSVQSSQQYGLVVARPPLMPGSYVQGPYGPVLLSPSVVPYPSWSPYPAPVSPSPHASPGTQPYGITQLSPSTPAYTGAYQPMPTPAGPSSSSQKEHGFPERPGEPECQYYMKHGDCKFGSSCRYHHPPELVGPKVNVVLSPIGLPLRPGAPHCTHYTLRGQCKFGAACKFDHPMGTLSYSPSASSLSDMPVAPIISGSTHDSMTTSSGLAGSTYSKSGPTSQFGPQQSTQKSDHSYGSSGTSGKEGRP